MSLGDLFTLQGTLFAMILVGMFLRKRGIIEESGKKCLTDLCVNVIIPCSIVKSCLVAFDPGLIRTGGLLLAVGFALQLLCVVLNKFLYNRYGEQQKKVLQYCTLVSNGGFLGNPVAEGVYGDMGLLYASLFLIPMRVVMWSMVTSYFVAGDTDKKKVIKNVLTHPCLVAVYIGLFLMFTQIPLPGVVEKAVRSIGGCNSAITMFLVGTILAEVKLLVYSVLRLGILPLIAWGVSLAVGMEPVATGVAVLMTGMPAGATAAIFAARYNSDAPFAARCVVLSTLFSMLTIPLWCWVVG